MDYKARYAQLNAEYIALINSILQTPSSAPETIPRVTQLAGQIATLLDNAAKELALVPNASDDLDAERTELVNRLQQIQRDYNGLVQNTDKLETLRRIRAYQDERWRPTFLGYLVAFFGLVLVLLLVVVVVRQRAIPATNPMSATMSPTLIY